MTELMTEPMTEAMTKSTNEPMDLETVVSKAIKETKGLDLMNEEQTKMNEEQKKTLKNLVNIIRFNDDNNIIKAHNRYHTAIKMDEFQWIKVI
ncbi:unnamed protein product [Brachionus calyciflorus]|uniref:Uncharacterized protein n=1 Tax=Brachionus calyciflorus TaxID=104777 RepID=A0A814Q6C8_9BILA|nr:unnamed protein product [Brachionus calyciflorus]